MNDSIAALGVAWDNLFDFARPRFLNVQSDGENLVPASFPVLGLMTGALAAVLWIFFSWISVGYAAGFIYTLAAWAVLSFKDSGTGDRRMAEALSGSWFAGNGRGVSVNIIYGIILALRFVILLLGALHGDQVILAVVLCGGFAMQGALAVSEASDQELFRYTPEATRNFYISCVICAVCCMLAALLTTLAAVLATVLLYCLFVRPKPDNDTELDADRISFCGTLTENILLLVTLVF